MDKGFLRKATPEEHEIVKEYEIGFAGKERSAAIKLFAISGVIAAVFLYYYISDPEKAFVCIFLSLFVIIFILFVVRSLVIGVRQKKKIFAGEYLMRKISVIARSDETVGYDLYKVTVSSEHGNKTDLEVDSSLYKLMLKGMSGILVEINDEKKSLFNNQYRFIPSIEYSPENAVSGYEFDDDSYTDTQYEDYEYTESSDKYVDAVAFASPSDTVQSVVASCYARRIRNIILRISICAAAFALALFLMCCGSLFARSLALYLEIPGIILSFAILFYLFTKTSRDIYNGNRSVLPLCAIGIIAHVFLVPFILGLVKNSPSDRIIFAAAAFILSLLFSILIHKEDLILYSKIRKSEYKVSAGRVTGKDTEIRLGYRRNIFDVDGLKDQLFKSIQNPFERKCYNQNIHCL